MNTPVVAPRCGNFSKQLRRADTLRAPHEDAARAYAGLALVATRAVVLHRVLSGGQPNSFRELQAPWRGNIDLDREACVLNCPLQAEG